MPQRCPLDMYPSYTMPENESEKRRQLFERPPIVWIDSAQSVQWFHTCDPVGSRWLQVSEFIQFSEFKWIKWIKFTELLIWVYSDPGVNSYAFRTNSLNNSNSCHSITQELRNSECLNQNFGLFELFHFANFCSSFRIFGLRHWDQSKSVWGCAWMQMFAFFQWHAENR